MVDPTADTSSPEADAAAYRLTLIETSVGDLDRDLVFAATKAAHMARRSGIAGRRLLENVAHLPIHPATGDPLPNDSTAPHGYIAVTYVWH